ncbi:MAG: glycosyltransferase [Bacteroidota bacterium]
MRGRIAHATTVHQPFDPRIFHRELRTLAQAGYDAHLIAPHAHDERAAGVAITALPRVASRGARWRLQAPLLAALWRLRPALLHVHDPEVLPAAFLAKRALGLRVIYDKHEHHLGRGLLGVVIRALEAWAYRWLDHVLLAEEAYAPFVHGVPATYVGNYVAPFSRPVAETTRRHGVERRLVQTGVLSRDRGLDRLLHLAAAIRRRGLPWRLDLIGVCHLEADRRWAEARVQAWGLGSVVRFVGWSRYVPWHDLMAQAAGADAGLFLAHPIPNHRLSLHTKFYEYLALGLPIVCSAVDRWRAFVEREGVGLAVEAHEAEATLDALVHLFADAPRYDAYVHAAQAAAPRYRWNAMADRLLEVYEAVLAP